MSMTGGSSSLLLLAPAQWPTSVAAVLGEPAPVDDMSLLLTLRVQSPALMLKESAPAFGSCWWLGVKGSTIERSSATA
jgi:hypothetical protein